MPPNIVDQNALTAGFSAQLECLGMTLRPRGARRRRFEKVRRLGAEQLDGINVASRARAVHAAMLPLSENIRQIVFRRPRSRPVSLITQFFFPHLPI